MSLARSRILAAVERRRYTEDERAELANAASASPVAVDEAVAEGVLVVRDGCYELAPQREYTPDERRRRVDLQHARTVLVARREMGLEGQFRSRLAEIDAELGEIERAVDARVQR